MVRVVLELTCMAPVPPDISSVGSNLAGGSESSRAVPQPISISNPVGTELPDMRQMQCSLMRLPADVADFA